MKAREERILADHKLARSGAQLEQLQKNFRLIHGGRRRDDVRWTNSNRPGRMPITEQNRLGLPPVGTIIGECELLSLMGAGGFGAVFRARQARLNREVAIKIVLPTAADMIENIAQRFLREIDLVARLEHPNIIRLYDFGETPQKLLWMSMELVRGGVLGELMSAGPVPFARAQHIVLQLLSGLIVAHEQGVIHRDLKPANIMLSRMGADPDHVKILDFGIGKAFGPGVDDRFKDLSNTGSVSYGTPRYMAPEQIYNLEVAPYTDLYAVALILYEMLVGRPAVGGETPFETLAHQVTQPIHFPAALLATPLGPVLLKGAEKEWANRYQTALEFFEALQNVPPDSVPPLEWDGGGAQTPVTGAFAGGPVPAGMVTAAAFRASTGSIETPLPFPEGDSTIPTGPHNGFVYSGVMGAVPAAEPKKSKAPLFIVVGLCGVAAAAGVLWFVLGRGPADTASSQGAAAPPPAEIAVGGAEPVESAAVGAAKVEPEAEQETIEFVADELEIPAPEPVMFTLHSAPEGAEVFDGEALLGATPMTLELPRDRFAADAEPLVVRKKGFEPVEVSMTPTDEEAVVHDLKLVKEKKASSSHHKRPDDSGKDNKPPPMEIKTTR